ncbi:MAG: carboxymuconolactone decarboxylase family protein [Bacteriovoracia bacterium]
MQFKSHDLTSAPAESKGPLEQVQKMMGFVPNLMKVFAESPTILKSYLTVSDLFQNSTLTPVEQQLVLLAVSVENQCDYCTAVHTTIGTQMAKIPTEVVSAVRKGESLSDQKLNALVQFTRGMVSERGKVSDDLLNKFTSAGYAQRNALEVITAIGLKTISNYTNHLAKPEIDAFFQEK